MNAVDTLERLKVHRERLGFVGRGRWSGPHLQAGFPGPFWIGPRCLVVVSVLDDLMVVVMQYTGGNIVVPTPLLEEVARRFFLETDLPVKATRAQRKQLEGVRSYDTVLVVPLEPDISDIQVLP